MGLMYLEMYVYMHVHARVYQSEISEVNFVSYIYINF